MAGGTLHSLSPAHAVGCGDGIEAMLLPRPLTSAPSAQWPRLETLTAGLALPEGYTFRPIAREEVSIVVDQLRVWYPDV